MAGEPAVTGTQQADPGAGGASEKPSETASGSTPSVTLAEVQDLLESFLTARDEQWGKVLQSRLDKHEAGLVKRLRGQQEKEAQLAADLATTLGLDEKQASALKAGALSKAIAAALEQSEDGKGGKGQKAVADTDDDTDDEEIDVEQAIAEVSAQGEMIATRWGLEPDDPEIKDIVTDGDPDEYLESIRLAGIAKKIRLAQTQSGTETKPVSVARLPAVTAGGTRASTNPIEKINSPGDLYKLAGQAEQARRAKK